MAPYKVKAAVVGAGFIGPVHVEALRRLGIEVTGVLGVDSKESENARSTLGLPKAYGSYEEVLNDPDVQSVHLAVPNVYHYEMAKGALAARKHVMCEKPLAMDTVETEELVSLANQSGVAAGVCYNIRFYPLNLHVNEQIKSGELGQIRTINGSYVQDWLLYDTDYNWRVLADQGGELRAVADIGTHWMDLVTSITGLQITEVFADLRTFHEVRQRPTGEVETFTGKLEANQDLEPVKIDTEDYGAILFRFENGARGSLWVSQVTAGRKNCIRYEIAGEKSAVAWESESPNQIWLGHRNEANRTLVRDPALVSLSTRHFTNYPGGHNEGFPDTFKQCFRAFYDYIEEGDLKAEKLFPTFLEGHQEVLLCEAILMSHKEERWVKIKEV